MKKLFLALTLVAVFAAASFAAVQDFGAFTLDVPANWTASQQGPTTVFTKNDNTASLSITVAETQGYALKDLADAFVGEFKKTFKSVGTPEASDGGFTWTMVTPNDVESKAILAGEGSKYALFVVTGAENAPDDISAMMDSLTEK